MQGSKQTMLIRTTLPVGCLIEALEARQLLSESLSVTISEGKSVIFSAPDGTLASIQYTGCSGAVTFSGTNLMQSTNLHGGIVVTGDTTSVDLVEVDRATSNNPSLTLHASSKQEIIVQNLSSSVDLNKVQFAKAGFEDGDIDAPLAMLKIGSLSDENVQLAGVPGPTAVAGGYYTPITLSVAGGVTDSVITSTAPFKSFTVGGSFTNTLGDAITPGAASLIAPGAWMVRIGGTSNSDFSFTGGISMASYPVTLGSFMVKGDVTGGMMNVTGSAWYIGASSFGGWNGTVVGAVASFKSTNDITNSNFSAGAIDFGRIGTNLINSNFKLTYGYSLGSYDLKKFSIGNSLLYSNISSVGNVGSVTGQFMSGSSLTAGVGVSYDFNGSLSPFISDASLGMVSFHCHTMMTTFADSDILAPSIGSMNLAGIDVTNGGVPFGVRVQTGIQKLTVGISGKGIKVFNVTNATSVADALAKAGVTDTVDFAVLVDP